LLTLSTLAILDGVSQPYHHGNLRQALLETATALAREAGPDAVVLREVARRTGVSHNAAYRHFADRDALLAAIADEAMGQLEQLMRRRLAEATATDVHARTRKRLRATGRAYVEFALGEPGLFEVAFDGFALFDEDDTYCPPIEGAFGLLNTVLDEGVAVGTVDPAHRSGAEVTCWAAVHGFAVLHQRGPLKVVPESERSAALEGMLDNLERALA
jgi:AcrR family transcriptional regulator